MNMGEIIKDAVNYPLSDWKKIMILGIIIFITGITSIFMSFGATNIYLISLLTVVGFLVGFLVNGYMFRIIRYSLETKSEIPQFDNLIHMGIDGIKVFIVFVVYSIPVILIISVSTLVFFDSGSVLTLESLGLDPWNFLINSLNSVILQGIMSFIGILDYLSLVMPEGIFAVVIGMLYLIIITPLFLVAIANMAYYDGEFKSAFKFEEILNEIRSIGWLNLLKWYVTTGIFFLTILVIISTVVVYIFSLVHLGVLGEILISLIVTPYFYMYFARSVALYYMPDE